MSLPLHLLHLDPLIDSRQLRNPQKSVFFALSGRLRDGHDFIPQLYASGLRHFVVRKIPPAQFPDAHFYKVPSPLRALQALAQQHRAQFALPVVAITGSNGKTIVKEWLFQLLQSHWATLKSPKSYNSQIGVALSVWRLRSHHQLALFEAGISQTREMGHLQAMLQPQLGIFTNIGAAHDAGFSNRQEKIREKWQLFQQSEHLIYPTDDAELHAELPQLAAQSGTQLMGWGENPEAQVPLWPYRSAQEQGVKLSWEGQKYRFPLPFSDAASVQNACHCLVAALHLGLPVASLQKGLLQLRRLPMRLAWENARGNSYLLNDAYNNDLSGLDIALDFLQHKRQQLPPHYRRVAILSDFLETGLPSEALYQQVMQRLQQAEVEELLAVGPAWQAFLETYSSKKIAHHSFREAQALQTYLREQPFAQSLILLKGARRFALEDIAQQLRAQVHHTVLEIDLQAIAHNLRFYRQQLRPPTRLMVMVKAFAYGSSAEVAQLLAYEGVDYLGVAYVDEGIGLREKGIQLPIMVMNPPPSSFGLLKKARLEPTLYNIAQLRAFASAVKEQEPYPVHIELDTGMHRLGFGADDLPELLAALAEYPQLEVRGIFSHLAASELEQERPYTEQQFRLFQEMADKIEAQLGYRSIRHILNTGGILRYPEAQLDMVRLGIGLHGIDPNGWADLLPVARLQTVISQLRFLPKGSSVGYGRASRLQRDSQIATLAIGYADGLDRGLSQGKGSVWIQGMQAPIVGNICMDMCFVDVTDIPALQIGDTAIVFGPEQSIERLAEQMGSIPYEVLTKVSGRVPRVFIDA